MTKTDKRLRDLLIYEPDTGLFRWKVDRILTSGRAIVSAGDIAGTRTRNGYVRIRCKGRQYSAHRLAWVFVHNRWPAEHIDHANGIKHDNRLCNLREATATQNNANARISQRSTSGLKGATWHIRKRRWIGYIHLKGRRIHLGYFDKPEDAHAAYVAKAKELYGEFARAA